MYEKLREALFKLHAEQASLRVEMDQNLKGLDALLSVKDEDLFRVKQMEETIKGARAALVVQLMTHRDNLEALEDHKKLLAVINHKISELEVSIAKGASAIGANEKLLTATKKALHGYGRVLSFRPSE